jgi:flavin-dependent dehydrogenase
MISKKTAIVGGGICGLYLAWRLASAGHKITVFEKKEEIGKKACSGLFSERILSFVPESKKLVQNEIDSVVIHFPKKSLNIRFSNKFLVMSHFELDNLAASLAQKAGAEIILGNQIDALPRGFEKIIGCDGPDSFVRRNLGLSSPEHRLAIQGFVFQEDFSAQVEVWPVESGFIWKIPRGKQTEYGVIARASQAKVLLDNFLKEKDIKINGLEAGLVPQGFVVPFHPSITLCGDAVGLCKPWSGGGVIWGLTAAELLLKNFPDFLKYRKELQRFFKPRIFLSKLLTRLVYFFGFKMSWVLPKNFKIDGDFLF